MKRKITFKEKALNVVRKIKEREVKTYKEVARLAGNEKAYRVVGNILKNLVSGLIKNKNLNVFPEACSGGEMGRCPSRAVRLWGASRGKHIKYFQSLPNFNIPCHRVIKNDYTIGAYLGSYKNSWLKLALLLKEGVISVMPTDTIYGICGTALKREVVEKIYKLRKRSPQKPMIILISDLDDLKIFGVKPNKKELEIIKKLWPGPVSIILDIVDKDKIKKFEYLHRGTRTLAFRLPKPKWLRDILKISGPLVAPSANWEGYEPAKTIKEAKKYFGNKVVYYPAGKIVGRPSTLIRLKNGELELIREGSFPFSQILKKIRK